MLRVSTVNSNVPIRIHPQSDVLNRSLSEPKLRTAMVNNLRLRKTFNELSNSKEYFFTPTNMNGVPHRPSLFTQCTYLTSRSLTVCHY